jgi:uncharacterized damage-inducible protein DinB
MKRYLLFATLLLAGAPLANAQAPSPAAAPADFRADFAAEMAAEETRVLRLAEAIPAEKYPWRPAEGVRSIAEVLAHIAVTNYTFPRIYGVALPAGVDTQALLKLSDKAQLLEALRASFAHVKQAASSMTEEETARLVPNSPWTRRRTMIFSARHLGEHMGQLIAYARVNGITPPWTEEAQQRQQPPPAKRPPTE